MDVDAERTLGDYLAEEMAELNELLAKHHVILPDGLQETELPGVKRPLVLYRGKPITREQVMQLITGEEPLFGPGGEEDDWDDPRRHSDVLESIFYRESYKWLETWVYSDGTIGGNLTCPVKFPEIYEILPRYLHLAEKYPFLDMVISFTTFDGCWCYFCDALEENKEDALRSSDDCRYKDCKPYLELISKYDRMKRSRNPSFEELYFSYWKTEHVRLDSGDKVELTVWIHEGKTEVLFGDRAREKFREYDGLYCAPEYAFMFSRGLHHYDINCVCDKTFVEDCFEYVGMPRERCDEYIEQGFLAPFNESARVVTKEWVIEQYRKYIAKYTD